MSTSACELVLSAATALYNESAGGVVAVNTHKNQMIKLEQKIGTLYAEFSSVFGPRKLAARRFQEICASQAFTRLVIYEFVMLGLCSGFSAAPLPISLCALWQ